MKRQTLMTLTVLNDLRHAGMDAFQAKHKLPSLLLFYSFIDVCASLSDESPSLPKISNRQRFENYLQRYEHRNWKLFSIYDLWAARSSLLHAYSPFGDHTEKVGGAKPIFYFSWPEKREDVDAALRRRGHIDFVLLEVKTIKMIAIGCFNSMFQRMQREPAFEDLVNANAEHLLKDLTHYKLEDELKLMDDLQTMVAEMDVA